MRWFFGKRREGRREGLLEGVPVRNELVRAAEIGKGLRLTAPLKTGGLRRIFGGGAGGAAEKTFELDELGAWVWGQVDGKRTVEGVIEDFARHFRVNLREAEVSVMAFLKILTQRNLIGIVAGGAGAAKRTATTLPRRHEEHEGPRRRRAASK